MQTSLKTTARIAAAASNMSEECALAGPGEPPLAMGCSIATPATRRCMCDWKNCEELRKEVLEKLPLDHPWRQNPYQVQTVGDTIKKLALRQSVIHHLSPSAEDRKNKTPYIHRHHFSLMGWQRSKKKTSLIDAETAKKWDEELGRKAYYDRVNSIEYILGILNMVPTERPNRPLGFSPLLRKKECH